MMNAWWIFAIVSGMALAGRNVLMKTATAKTDPALAAMVLSVSMAIVSIGFLLYSRMTRSGAVVSGPIDTGGIVMAGVAGVSLAAANIFLALSYKSGGGAGMVAILQNGFSISVTVLIGVLFLAEVIKPHQMLGMLLAMAGIFLIVKR